MIVDDIINLSRDYIKYNHNFDIEDIINYILSILKILYDYKKYK